MPDGSDASATNLSWELAQFVATTRAESIPASVIDRIKKSVLDVLGCAIYGATFDTMKPAIQLARDQRGAPEASVWRFGDRVPATNASLLNGSFVQATEMAEGFSRAVVHPGNAVIPGLLSIAEREQCSGIDFLTSAALGYELLIRLGLATKDPHFLLQTRGLYGAAVLAPFGLTAACARLMRWETAKVSDALGVASVLTPSFQLAGMYQQATIKDLYQGLSSYLGVLAIELVERGITGIRDWVRPWYQAMMVNGYSLDGITDQLAERWYVSSGGLHVKVRPLVAMSQAVVGALDDLLRHETIDPDSVVRVTAESSGRIEVGRIMRPATLLAARASIPFLVAAILLNQDTFLADKYMVDFLHEAMLEDKAIADMSLKVDLVTNREYDYNMEYAPPSSDVNNFIKLEARVTIDLADGRSVSAYHDVFAHTGNLAWEQVTDKFYAVTERHIERARAEQIVAAVQHLEELSSVTDLVAFLV